MISFPAYHENGDLRIWWNPFDFHYHFWFFAAYETPIWCRGATNWTKDDVELNLMGGEL